MARRDTSARRRSPRSALTCTSSGTRAGTTGPPNVWLAVSDDGGRQLRPADPERARGSDQLHPSVAADGDQVVVAWQEFAVAPGRRPRPDRARALQAERPPARRDRARRRQRRERQVAPGRRALAGQSRWSPGSTSATSDRMASRSSTSMRRAEATRAPASARACAWMRARRSRSPSTSTTSGPRRSPSRARTCTSPGPTSATTTGRSSARAPATAAAPGPRTCASTTTPQASA